MLLSFFSVGIFFLSFFVATKTFAQETPRLPVLMYHKISGNGHKDELTVQSQALETQFNYMRQEGFTPILLSQLVDYVKRKKPLPENPVLITFDDGYRDNYLVMYPLLKKYGMKANIFLVPAYLQEREPVVVNGDMGYLMPSDVLSMDSSMVEFGLHSFDHKNYKDASLQELDADIVNNKRALQQLGIRFQPCLAFPYGAYPKKNPFKKHYFFKTLSLNEITLAFRIGNRLNPLPLNRPLLIKRLDVKPDMSLAHFASLLQKAKLKSSLAKNRTPERALTPAYETVVAQ